MFPVEPAATQIEKFDLASMLDAAFDCARSQADKVGATCDCSRAGSSAEAAHGDANQIQQLITRFAESLREISEASSIRVSATAGQVSSDILPVKLTWSAAPAENNPAVRSRVRAIVAASASLRATQMGTAEAGLAAAWQLALRLDGKPKIVTRESGRWHLEVTIPLTVTSPAASDPPGTSAPPPEMQSTAASRKPETNLEAAQALTETATQVATGVPAS